MRFAKTMLEINCVTLQHRTASFPLILTDFSEIIQRQIWHTQNVELIHEFVIFEPLEMKDNNMNNIIANVSTSPPSTIYTCASSRLQKGAEPCIESTPAIKTHKAEHSFNISIASLKHISHGLLATLCNSELEVTRVQKGFCTQRYIFVIHNLQQVLIHGCVDPYGSYIRVSWALSTRFVTENVYK
jgi:hypothetical protein